MLESVLQTLPQIRKREWPVDGMPLLAKMNMKLQISQAAAAVATLLLKAESHGRPSKSPVDGRVLKGPTRETLSLLMDVADACIASPWRRLRSCESLFGTVLSAVSELGALQGKQTLRVILLRIKTLVVSTCAQVSWRNESLYTSYYLYRGLNVLEAFLSLNWYPPGMATRHNRIL